MQSVKQNKSKQQPPETPSLDGFSVMPGHLLRRAHQNSTALFAEYMQNKGIDITPFQFATLSAISQYPKQDQATIAKLTGVDRATLGGVVERLCEKGLITRETSTTDRRAKTLHITLEGAMQLASIRKSVTEINKAITAGLSPAEERTLVDLLQRITIRRPVDPE